MDIYFYNLDFELVHILPSSSKDRGYISANAQIDFCDEGKFEVLYYDEELRKLLKLHPEGLLIKWGKFQGFLSDWQNREKESRIFGMHLNGILHKIAIPILEEESANAVAIAKKIIDLYDWVEWIGVDKNLFKEITFSTDKYSPGDEVIKKLCSAADCGYKVFMKNKKLYFELIPKRDNPLILSEGNLNAYEFQEDFDLKTAASGGWYKLEQPETDGNKQDPVWTFTGTENGVKGQIVILSSTTEAAANDELAALKISHSMQCKTRNVELDKDYMLGDILRISYENTVQRNLVKNIKLWYEKCSYHEEPIFEGADLNE